MEDLLTKGLRQYIYTVFIAANKNSLNGRPVNKGIETYLLFQIEIKTRLQSEWKTC